MSNFSYIASEKQIEVLDPLSSAFHQLKLKDIYSVAEVAIRLSLFSEEAGIFENALQVCKTYALIAIDITKLLGSY